MTVVGAISAAAVGLALAALAVTDARTQRVPVRPMVALTALSPGVLGIASLMASEWTHIVNAVVGLAIVVGVQLLPFVVQHRTGKPMIGRADVRLAPTFGFTLGWYGAAFAAIGLLVALVAGLAIAAATRRSRIPFVPPLTIGYWIALTWAWQ